MGFPPRSGPDGFARTPSRGRVIAPVLKAGYERRELIAGALQKVKQVVDEAGHDARVSTDDDDQGNQHNPAHCSAHGYRSRDAACVSPPALVVAAPTAAGCSLPAPVAVALETRFIGPTVSSKLLAVGMPGAHPAMQAQVYLMAAGSERPHSRWSTACERVGSQSAAGPCAASCYDHRKVLTMLAAAARYRERRKPVAWIRRPGPPAPAGLIGRLAARPARPPHLAGVARQPPCLG
jgi:hypothetical protein